MPPTRLFSLRRARPNNGSTASGRSPLLSRTAAGVKTKFFRYPLVFDFGAAVMWRDMWPRPCSSGSTCLTD